MGKTTLGNYLGVSIKAKHMIVLRPQNCTLTKIGTELKELRKEGEVFWSQQQLPRHKERE